MTLVELQALAKRLGMPGFASKQIASWLYEKKVTSIDEMTNLSLKHRELLKQDYEVGALPPVDEMRSVDGTVKYLYRVGDNHYVESVYIPDDDRATLCVSSQVGCKMNCKFCMTGKQGFTANLTANQIINQIHSLPECDKLTNVAKKICRKLSNIFLHHLSYYNPYMTKIGIKMNRMQANSYIYFTNYSRFISRCSAICSNFVPGRP